jgi:hypothetical protein
MSNHESIRPGACAPLLLAAILAAAGISAVAEDPPAVRAGDRPAAGEKELNPESPSVLDLIPDDAALAIGVPNLVRLEARGDRLLKATNPRSFELSDAFQWAYKYLGVEQIVDEERPVAAMLVNVRDAGREDGDGFENIMETLVIHIPVTDPGEAAKRFGLSEDAVAEETIAAANGNARFAMVRGDYLLLAWNKRAIESVIEGEVLGSAIAEDRRAAAADADFLVLAGTKAWGKSWDDYVEDIRAGNVNLPDVPQKEEIKSLLQKTIPDARFALVTGHIEDGIQLRMLARFHGGGTAEEALTDLGSGAEPAVLAGLPRGNLLAAVAATGEELSTVDAARLLLPVVLNTFNRPELLRDNDPGRLVGTFDAIRSHLEGCRIALYATGAKTPTELSDRGAMATVFVLRTDDPENLVASIAREGIALGGDADGGAAARIPLRRASDQRTITGHAVERLEIDTAAVDPDLAGALREAFGPAWMYLRAVKHDGRVVVLLGSEIALLEKTLANLDASESGLLGTPPLQQAQSRLDAAHQAVLYVSLRRTLPTLVGFAEDAVEAMNEEIDRVSAFALVIEDQAVQVEIWIPLAELQAIPEKWRSGWF